MSERGGQEFNYRRADAQEIGTGSYEAVCIANYDQLICATKLLYQVIF